MGIPSADLAAGTVDEQFLHLICNDPKLLADEFDAIIAAECPWLPSDGGGPKAAAGPPAGRARAMAARPVDALASRPRHPGAGGWARQRSPPIPAQGSDDR